MNSDQSVEVMTQEQAIHKILIGRELSVHAYTKLYKRALFQKVRYPVGKISEDAYIIMDIMDQVKKSSFYAMFLVFLCSSRRQYKHEQVYIKGYDEN
jgi:hypothetical protein